VLVLNIFYFASLKQKFKHKQIHTLAFTREKTGENKREHTNNSKYNTITVISNTSAHTYTHTSLDENH